ncbi:diacylglycerol kinase family lipid kinase [Epidermidibacterium keratini]|uniref:Diacylglycerol kinase family lipid kinase n=1 Tax=Epidermidibacterium keratini TaxID=1891644 RepID=A0A7L4YT10_9ACTN|nr:diacylglycerol kinase family protein [Epidermidibacterium keratini]QHC01667.1 diacylglycerol kinase family lipid kinase [Epidermidibacterium keratini]
MRALLVTNPKATSTTPRVRDVILGALSRDLDLQIAHTDRRGHAMELGAQARRDGFELVIALGGDGTVNELVNGMLADGLGDDVPALAALPGGSANVFARALGLANDPVDATGQLLEALRAGRVRRIGLGQVEGRWFVFSAGLGFDAQVVRDVELRRGDGRKATPYLYASTAIRGYLGRRKAALPPMTIELPDGTTVPDVFLTVVTHTTPWTYYGRRAVHVTPKASYDSGLDVFALRPLGALRVGRILWQVTRKVANPRGGRVHLLHDLNEFTIRADAALPLQVDGDYAGDVSVASFRDVPAALSVIA